MFDVSTDHQIVAVGTETMQLLDADGALIVAAERTTDNVWIIHADVINDTTADTRSAAIDALKAHALALPDAKPGYSTTVPYGLRAQP